MMHPSRAYHCVVRALAAAIVAAGLACSSDSTSPRAVSAITLTPDTDSVAVGATVTLHAAVTDPSGNPVGGQQVFWNTENPGIATVSDAGVVSGVATGSVRISASAAGKSAVASITVLPPPVSVVVVTPALDTIVRASTVHLTATLLDAGGNTLTGRAITWSSSEPAIATVDGTGLVTGDSAGSATITATSEGKSGSAAIVVVLPPAASVTVTPDHALLLLGQSVQLSATANDASGNPIPGAPITWSSSNESVATVTDSGLVQSQAIGIATITAQSGSASGKATVTVGP